MSDFEIWLEQRGLPDTQKTDLIAALSIPNLFETPDRIMQSDDWFYCPQNTRFIVIGKCPNGDGISIDTGCSSGAVFYICHETMHSALEQSFIKVASSLRDYVDKSQGPDFPTDYWEAVTNTAEQGAAANP